MGEKVTFILTFTCANFIHREQQKFTHELAFRFRSGVFTVVNGCLWVYMGVYECLSVPRGVYGILGIYGCL